MDKQLCEHQAVMLGMLNELDRICKKHGISYMLFAGTMLGAVRHCGFIPWDDDLDVVMLRDEYEHFLYIAPSELDKDTYYLQKEFSANWPMYFSKLRKNGTTCIERYIPKNPNEHHGIYIDIFPCDNLSDVGFIGRLQFLASKAVIAKSLDKRGYLTESLSKKLFILICRLLPSKPLAKFVNLRGKSSTKRVHTFFGGARAYDKNIFPREWLEQSALMRFEDGDYPASIYYNEILTKMYGDYMTPLPENERGCKLHGEIVDTNRSYTEYVDVFRKITFKEYTRSIR